MHLRSASDRSRTARTPEMEVPIRTLGFSLIAVAAIASSLLLTRQRQEATRADDAHPGERAAARPSLDDIRAAGL